MQKLVVDLSVWIDLYSGGILEQFLLIDAQVLVSDAQLFEVEKEKGLNLDRYFDKLAVCSYSPSEISLVESEVRRYPGLSPHDILCSMLAMRENALLLTGDSDLKQYSVDRGVSCHGVLWVLDMLVAERLIEPRTAHSALINMIEAGARLPAREVEKRLALWKQSL